MYNTQSSIFIEDNKSVVSKAIERIKFASELCQARGQQYLYVCYSGGKDSLVLAHLCKVANIPYKLHYNVTGIDPPELLSNMGKTVPDLKWHKYELSMWQLIVKKKMPPTRLVRYCCSELKEHGGEGQICATGVRWAESAKRKSRRPFEQIGSKKESKMLFNDNDEGRRGFENCMQKNKQVVNPIIDFTDSDIWYYIKHEELNYCKLYDCGYKRLGCIGCPQATLKNREKDFEKYPYMKAKYIKAFDKMLVVNKHIPYTWKTGEDVFKWWLYGNDSVDIINGQLSFFNEDTEDEMLI